MTPLRCLALFAAALLFASATFDDVDPAGSAGKAPAGWFVPTRGYSAVMVDDGVDGGACVKLLSVEDATNAANFGNFMRMVDATPYRGKFVRLRAALRFEGSERDGAQMWLRVDREQGQGFFDNMADRPVRDDNWEHYEIVGDVADDAKAIAIGVMLMSRGRTWIDDVTVEVLDEVPGLFAEPPRKLARRELDNLVALTEVLGHVRHFHPSDEATTADWDALAATGVRRVSDASSARALSHALTELIAPIAPTVTIVPTARADAIETAAPSDHDTLSWVHHGFGNDGTSGVYMSQRLTTPSGSDAPAAHRLDLPGGVTAFVPLAVEVKDGKTLPPATAEPIHLPAPRYGSNDRSTRLATVALAWNIFEHYYPYFDVVDVDWDEQLREALELAAEDNSEEEFLWTLKRLVASLRDGHGYVGHASDARAFSLPLLFAWASDDLVVTQVGEVEDVVAGDVVVSIDGVKVSDWAHEMRQYISAANEAHMRHGLANEVRRGRLGATAALTLRRPNGRAYEVDVAYGRNGWSLRDPRPEPIDEISPDVFYVDIGAIDDDTYTEALPRLASARRVVFDFRGYPSRLTPHTFFGPLIDGPTTSAQWHVPHVTLPGVERLFTQVASWQLSPTEPHVDAELVFITDGRAISYAESCMGIVEHYELGAIVGEATAGTNGNINPFTLLGGYRVSWTGMKVLKHDGTPHHGIGVLPTVPVERTVKGIAAGRDELLETALALELKR